MSKRLLLALPLIALLAACSSVTRTHGNMVDAESLGQIHPGVSRQADVAALLGTPTSEGTFDPNIWYYVGQVSKQAAFFAPEVTERNIVRVSFDPATGTVSKVETFDKSAGSYVEMVDRTTPTAGHNLSVMEQVLGNVGRFTPKDDSK